jgi:hypothetical protein
VFAPTSSFGARRVLLSKAAREDLEFHQVDIKTAFLNGELEEKVYVSQPPGFCNGEFQVCRLNKALYGHRTDRTRAQGALQHLNGASTPTPAAPPDCNPTVP